MTLATADARLAAPSALSLVLRLALRELRGGLRGFYVFVACIALGVMAIAGVGSFAGSIADGLAVLGGVQVQDCASRSHGFERRQAETFIARWGDEE